MERFIIRNPRKKQESPPRKIRQSRQSTLHDLKRVVVLEDIKRWKCVLELPQQTSENLLETLQQLKKKIPSEDVIRSTKIGEAVQRLETHGDPEVSHLAREVHTQWETFIQHNRGKASIEVRSDATTEKLRSNARRMLCEALQGEAADALAECIEREVFHRCSRLINVPYRRTVRTLVFALKHKAEARSQLQDGLLQVKEFVQRHKK
ncbi:transcription elongation factor A N-terminal and central domain-containing protein 2 isoform 2-T2 [Discoglossus pictus]